MRATLLRSTIITAWAVFDNHGTPFPDPGNFSAKNAGSALTTPTYDGSGQAIHPSVVKLSAAWNGYAYWMAITPYAFSNAALENPSILASNDGDTWVVPDGLTNPIEPSPASGWNADTELVYNADDDKLYCFYMQVRDLGGGSFEDDIKVISSSDGITWGGDTILFTANHGTNNSPCVVYDGSQWVMYTGSGGEKRRTADAPGGPWSADLGGVTNNNTPADLTQWHNHITLSDGIYYKLCAEANDDIYLAVSDDGVTFYFAQTPLLSNGTGAAQWDNQKLYRGCAVKISGGLDIWYSGQANDNAWHVGRTQATLST